MKKSVEQHQDFYIIFIDLKKNIQHRVQKGVVEVGFVKIVKQFHEGIIIQIIHTKNQTSHWGDRINKL